MARDSARTKQSILAAAHAEFAAHGIAGARMDRIASSAGCNKERIYGHFGNKEALFAAVLAEAILALADQVRPGEGTTAEYIGRLFDYHRADPSVLRLLMFEALYYGDGLIETNEDRRDWYRNVIVDFTRRTGMSEREAGRTLLTLIGIGAWPLAMPQLTSLLTGPDALTDAPMDEMRAFLIDFAQRAVELPG
ncbi:TetR family transcriptional regulator [Gordonia sp. ABSL1-1]|uniref:TetR/AcrR family transcriptional regulator n=1 Tax=Gordonia sp. ABSL1-1 TaxID=3053923 RepID=UPI0025738DAB|nr:TetR family transcriptional regulator [Gordonia sp. ABSL1-1]MDL9936882.1 TetR family transcriptional regulator [Gordonia sp. ABSL1-1]